MIWIFSLFSALAAHASTLESRTLADMAKARSPQAVTELYQSYQHLQITERACHIQLRERLLPSACYDLLKLQSASHQLNAAEGRQRSESLDRLCLQAAKDLRMDEKMDLQNLSPPCAKYAREAQDVRAYQAEDRIWSEN